MAAWVLALALVQAAATAPPQVHAEPLAGSLPPLEPPDDRGPRGFRQRGPLFISPMGEPFHGHDPHYQWFDQADTNHDGVVTRDEFVADAMRWFAVLDRGHDGEIDPDDVEYYEKNLAPEIRVGGGGGASGMRRSSPNGGGGRGGRGGGGRGGGGGGRFGGGQRGSGESSGSTPPAAQSYGRQGAARYSWFDYPEPVTVADTNFNRGVDKTEWRNAAEQRFDMLDHNHDGRLKRGELPRLPDQSETPGRGGNRNGRERFGGPGSPPQQE